MSTFLLEVGSEELPAGFIPRALEDMQERARAWLQEQRLPPGQIRATGTPRRLVLTIEDVPARQSDAVREVKGPAVKAAFGPDGAPTKAAQGFARSQGVAVESLVRRSLPGGEFVFAVVEQPGKPAAEVLPHLVAELITRVPLTRGMRWGSTSLRFERPIRWLVALLDGDALPARIEGLEAGRSSAGHRFLAPGPLAIPSAQAYQDTLRQAHVHVDQAERARLVEEQVRAAAAEVGGHVRPDPGLVEEVVFLVEEPKALVGSFEKEFLEIPEEASTTVMKRHQRYFPVYDGQDRLLPHFVVVTNGGGDPAVVRAGNERVLRARLSDARFFYQEDLKVPLGERVEALKKVTFMEGMGTLYDKIGRLEPLAALALDMLGSAGNGLAEAVSRAARLCKADLTTNMVRELTELQGVMGRHYAQVGGEPPEVAQAIAEHYLPAGPASPLPQTATGVALSLAEKFDNLAACFARGFVPTGSNDPFALRRQTSGIVQISWERELHLDAEALLELAGQQVKAGPDVRDKMTEYLLGRLRAELRDRNLTHDTVDAVLAAGAPLQDLLLPKLKAHALQEWLLEVPEEAKRTVFSADRVARLGAAAPTELIDVGLFEKDAEGALFARLQAVDAATSPLLAAHDYRAMLAHFTQLNDAIERFFDFHEGVFVMVKDNPALQRNRLALLRRLADLYRNVADFRLVAVSREEAQP